ncbi:MAG: deoxyribose-phosphate aldolase [Anaerococcus prevotii]|uniref:deoxyribose-phosphate aldolase n=1 Tax=Anaerococcus prevotii TaxID=33034 RepID=UPI0028FED584|nr:deoxyribose-phosphate aldolase [Anaerococcus prevotii]MDU2557901.1 deoxyribose-phosphate aldolase [Anaerococcus prevotii]
MENKEIYAHIDHTLLKAFAKWEDIEKLCDEAVKYQTASVCIPQTYIKRVKEKYGDKLTICTVIGFPLGYNLTESKIVEAEQSLANGASEIDMVVNISDVKNGDYEKVEDEIRAIKEAIGDKILKVIIETCYLTEEEKIAMCEAVTKVGADYIKTSTGFGTDGARMEDVILFKKYIGDNVKIKAAGGVRTKEDLIAFIEAGCDRIGTSSAIKMLKGEENKSDY